MCSYHLPMYYYVHLRSVARIAITLSRDHANYLVSECFISIVTSNMSTLDLHFHSFRYVML